MAMGAAIDLFAPVKARGTVAVVVCALAAFGFWLWMPYVYGKYMHDRDIMIWNRNWVEGDWHYKSEREADRLAEASKK
jgi:hypothetical protein